MLKSYSNDEVIELYQKNWNDIFYNDTDRRLWDSTRIFGNVERTNLEFLLYCVATIKWGKDDNIFKKLRQDLLPKHRGSLARKNLKGWFLTYPIMQLYSRMLSGLQEQLKTPMIHRVHLLPNGPSCFYSFLKSSVFRCFIHIY